jgi:hypothetical protein
MPRLGRNFRMPVNARATLTFPEGESVPENADLARTFEGFGSNTHTGAHAHAHEGNFVGQSGPAVRKVFPLSAPGRRFFRDHPASANGMKCSQAARGSKIPVA